MTETTPTLNFSLLEGLEPGTDEYNEAAFMMIVDFGAEVIYDIVFDAALMHRDGETSSPVVDLFGFGPYIGKKINEQDSKYGELWNEFGPDFFPIVVKTFLKTCEHGYMTSDREGLWFDLEAATAAYVAAEEEAAA